MNANIFWAAELLNNLTTVLLGAMAPTYKPHQFYCAHPVVPSCRTGFVSQGAYVQHRNAIHSPLQRPSRPHQHPFQRVNSNPEGGSEGNLGAQMPPQGSYFTVHPVLDGAIIQLFRSNK